MGIWLVSVAGNTQICEQRAEPMHTPATEEARVFCGAAWLPILTLRVLDHNDQLVPGETILTASFLHSCSHFSDRSCILFALSNGAQFIQSKRIVQYFSCYPSK